MLRVRTTLNGFTGGPGLMTNYFQCTTEDAAAATRCVGYVQALLSGALRIMLWNSVTWEVQHQVDEITTADGHIVGTHTATGGNTGAGTAGTTAAPIASAALVRWLTSTFVGGRRLRGRSFISPIAHAAVDVSGTLDNTILSGVNGALTPWVSSMTAGDKAVIWHRPVAGAGGYAGDITGGSVQDKLAVLTSRRD